MHFSGFIALTLLGGSANIFAAPVADVSDVTTTTNDVSQVEHPDFAATYTPGFELNEAEPIEDEFEKRAPQEATEEITGEEGDGTTEGETTEGETTEGETTEGETTEGGYTGDQQQQYDVNGDPIYQYAQLGAQFAEIYVDYKGNVVPATAEGAHHPNSAEASQYHLTSALSTAAAAHHTTAAHPTTTANGAHPTTHAVNTPTTRATTHATTKATTANTTKATTHATTKATTANTSKTTQANTTHADTTANTRPTTGSHCKRDPKIGGGSHHNSHHSHNDC